MTSLKKRGEAHGTGHPISGRFRRIRDNGGLAIACCYHLAFSILHILHKHNYKVAFLTENVNELLTWGWCIVLS